MSRRGERGARALPDDLDALGRALEHAAERQLARRRLFTRFAQAMAIIAVAVPAALAVWTAELNPGLRDGSAERPPPTEALTTDHPRPNDDVADRGDPPSELPTRRCLDGRACAGMFAARQ